jgi:hypothetical protein
MKNILQLLILTLFVSCTKEVQTTNGNTLSDCAPTTIGPNSEVKGYGILAKLPAIWNGPVYSPTPLGSFPEWIVDFRPISPAQVSAKNELDSLNDIFMSFFVVRHDCAFKLAFRNGGGFAGMTRNSYMVIDSVYEGPSEQFYRFSDPISGGQRVYTDLRFKADSLIMFTYTNHYNTLPQPQLHMHWKAKRQDSQSAQQAITLFNYPQKQVVRDFTTTFDGLTESIFYSAAADPYPESEQPHLGQTQVTISVQNPASPDANKKVLILITTQPLFSGVTFLSENLKYRSRYVLVGAASQTGYLFNYMHPGSYYVNAIYDNNGDGTFSSGDYMNSAFDVPVTLTSEGQSAVNVTINFQIP